MILKISYYYPTVHFFVCSGNGLTINVAVAYDSIGNRTKLHG